MFSASVNFFDRLMQRYTPDPYLIAVILTAVVSLLALGTTDSGPNEVVSAWGNGFWTLLTFTLQMALILIGGYIVASSPPVTRTLKLVCSQVRSPFWAVMLTTLISALASLLNWGLGLVIGAFLAKEMAKAIPKVNFRVLVASAYSGFLFWHGGFSGSIPLVVNTPGNFSFEMVGRLIPLTETIYSPLNLTAILGLLILLPATNWLLHKTTGSEESIVILADKSDIELAKDSHTFSEKIESSQWPPILFSLFALYFVILQIQSDKFRIDLNTINFLFLFLGLVLHRRTKNFLKAINQATEKVGPILIQYPIYAGIMGIMKQTGLAEKISDVFVQTASKETFNLFTFYGAGLVNFFVPSGGGQWAVQAPVVIPAAQQLGVNVSSSIMAVAWGDAWTNMAQPFWALPLLVIAGLGAKDILGFTLTTLVVSGVYLSALFLIF